MHTRHVEGMSRLDHDQAVVALIAAMPTDSPGWIPASKFIALLGTDKMLCRVVRTDSEQEHASVTRGLADLGVVRTELTALNGFVFDGIYRPAVAGGSRYEPLVHSPGGMESKTAATGTHRSSPS